MILNLETRKFLIYISSVIKVVHNFARIRIDSYNSLAIEKILTFHKVSNTDSQLLMRINITTTIFLEKYSYKDSFNTNIFK